MLILEKEHQDAIQVQLMLTVKSAIRKEFNTHRNFNRRRITLALGGGAARGFAHIGAIRALNEHQVPFDMIVGVSMGAIVGSCYALVPDVDFTRERMSDLVYSDAFNESLIGTWSKTFGQKAKNILKRMNSVLTRTNAMGKMFFAKGILENHGVTEVLGPYLPDIRISNTRIPFACAAVELKRGLLKIFYGNDNLREAVIASASMPLVFPPRVIEGVEYVDGGVLDKIGIDSCNQLSSKFIIAIDVSDEKLPDNPAVNALDVMLKTEEIASLYRRERQFNRADVIIQPISGTHHWADYSAWKEFIDMGYEKTRSQIKEIKSKLRWMPIRRHFAMFRRLRS